jgi:hypothetical protein
MDNKFFWIKRAFRRLESVVKVIRITTLNGWIHEEGILSLSLGRVDHRFWGKPPLGGYANPKHWGGPWRHLPGKHGRGDRELL